MLNEQDLEQLRVAGVKSVSERDVFVLTYRKLGSFRGACETCGVKAPIGYLWLKKSGDLAADSKDAGSFATEAARLGNAAEREFQRLVPDAAPANNIIRASNPVFDFVVHGVTVDVKYSAINKDGVWKFAFAKRKRMKPDFYALFFATAESGELADGYRLFLVPHELFAGRASMTMRPGHPTHPLNHYEIAPDELSAALKEAIR